MYLMNFQYQNDSTFIQLGNVRSRVLNKKTGGDV